MIKKTMSELNRLSTKEFIDAEKVPIIFILDNVRSMNNVGSVFRTADVFLLHALYLCGITPTPPHRDINKTALGATETVAWKYFESTDKAILQAIENGFNIIAIEQVHGSMPLQKFKIEANKKYAFVFGNEVEGVSDTALALCHSALEIEQAGSKHSLNISVSAGIVGWWVSGN